MGFGASLGIALTALARHALRSTLTMLGIIIGVAAVIAMIAIGRGAQERVAEQIQSLGSNVLIVWPGTRNAQGLRLATGTAATLTEDDAAAIAREVPQVRVAAPSSRSGVQLISGNVNWGSTAYGVTNDYLEARGWSLQDGRLFEAAEMSGAGKVALIGRTVANELFGDIDPIDRTMRIGRVPVTVIGILAPKGQNAWGSDQDDVVMVPIGTLRHRIQGQPTGRQKVVTSINIKVAEGTKMSDAQAGVRELLRQRHRLLPGDDDDFGLRDLTEVLQTQEASSRVLTLLLSAVAGVSLLVGGIGIMNIMLVSVTERTREIGLRMAVGARARDILLQFMVEATALSLIGGLIGVAVGIGAALVIGDIAGWRTTLTLDSIVLAFGFSALVGVFFGFYPARAASRLQPIDALRHE